MIRTRIRPEGLDEEGTFRVAQLVIDGYSGGTLEEGQLVGLLVKSGDVGANTLVIGANDGYVEQVSDGYVMFRGLTTIANDILINALDNGQDIAHRSLTSLEAIGTTQQHTSSLAVPAGAEVTGISTYVVVQPPGTTTMRVGVAGSRFSRKRYGAGISTVANSSHRGLETPNQFYQSSVPVVINFDTAPTAATGSIRLTIHYRQITPADS